MCKDCGCEAANHQHSHHHHHHDEDNGSMKPGAHCHYDENGNVYYHTHTHTHHHDSDAPASETVTFERAVLAVNDSAAEANREFFTRRGIAAFNLISSPGSGKTLLLEKTLELLKARGIATAVIVGDQYGRADAERMERSGFGKVTQIETGDSCHLNAAQVGAVLESAVPENTQIVLIENVGNLVCPVAFDLGENAKIALLSTPEGEEKPLKYPALFAAAELVLLTKCDLAEVLEYDLALAEHNVREVNPEAQILRVSAKKTQNLDAWVDFLAAHLIHHSSVK